MKLYCEKLCEKIFYELAFIYYVCGIPLDWFIINDVFLQSIITFYLMKFNYIMKNKIFLIISYVNQ